MANEIQKSNSWDNVILTTLTSRESALPTNFNKTRFVQNTVAFLMNADAKMQAFLKSENGIRQVQAGLLKGAFLGLDFLNKECYLIPYGNTLNFQMDYKGAKKVAKRYSTRPILDIFAEVIREKDTFDYKIVDGEQTINHSPNVLDKGSNIVGAYAVCKYVDGGKLIEVMNMEELEAAKRKSKNPNTGPWKDFTNEMYKKTVLRRLCKHIDISFENTDQYETYSAELEEKGIEEEHKEDIGNANSKEFTEI